MLHNPSGQANLLTDGLYILRAEVLGKRCMCFAVSMVNIVDSSF